MDDWAHESQGWAKGASMQVKTVLLALGALAASATGSAACSSVSFDIAAHDLNRLARAATVDDAAALARRARSSVEDAEISISFCCPMAAMELDESARHLRRAANENNPTELAEHRRRAIRAFNDAVDNWNARLC
jgi:hypothetical protein